MGVCEALFQLLAIWLSICVVKDVQVLEYAREGGE